MRGRCAAVAVLFLGLPAGILGPVLGCGGAPAPSAPAGAVPPEARSLLAFIRQHGHAPPDHLGGRVFPNYDGVLPRFDARGKRILYREWEVCPKARGGDGGRERLVTGSDGRAWYTGDRGRTFLELK
jgi:guanyl-specific ribonuclease Sa